MGCLLTKTVMANAGNVPAAKIANCHAHPVALLSMSSLWKTLSPPGVFATQPRVFAHQSYCTSW